MDQKVDLRTDEKDNNYIKIDKFTSMNLFSNIM